MVESRGTRFSPDRQMLIGSNYISRARYVYGCTMHPFFDEKGENIILVENTNNQPKKGNKDSKDLVNEQIRFPQVLLIGPDGEQLGTMSSRDAQRKAFDYDLDLLCVAPGANPPVCKLVNYGKFRFEQQKKMKEAKKNQKVIETKEVRLTPQIGIHDVEIKAKAAIKFFEEGNKVKVCVRFKGRQLTHIEVGEEVLNKFIELVSEYASVEKPGAMEGRWMIAILAPKKK